MSKVPPVPPVPPVPLVLSPRFDFGEARFDLGDPTLSASLREGFSSMLPKPPMRYTARLLPPREYARLPDMPADTLPDARRALIVVVENEQGEIVGRWMAADVVVLEGLQIAESHRKNPSVARLLLGSMLQVLTDRQIGAVLTIVQDEAVAHLAEHAGFVHVPGALYQKDLR